MKKIIIILIIAILLIGSVMGVNYRKKYNYDTRKNDFIIDYKDLGDTFKADKINTSEYWTPEAGKIIDSPDGNVSFYSGNIFNWNSDDDLILRLSNKKSNSALSLINSTLQLSKSKSRIFSGNDSLPLIYIVNLTCSFTNPLTGWDGSFSGITASPFLSYGHAGLIGRNNTHRDDLNESWTNNLGIGSVKSDGTCSLYRINTLNYPFHLSLRFYNGPFSPSEWIISDDDYCELGYQDENSTHHNVILRLPGFTVEVGDQTDLIYVAEDGSTYWDEGLNELAQSSYGDISGYVDFVEGSSWIINVLKVGINAIMIDGDRSLINNTGLTQSTNITAKDRFIVGDYQGNHTRIKNLKGGGVAIIVKTRYS